MLRNSGNNQELRLFEDKLSDISTDLSIKYSKVFSIIDISYPLSGVYKLGENIAIL